MTATPHRPRASTPTASLSMMLREPLGAVEEALGQVEWAESEIAAAIQRHPEQRDLLFHGFGLLTPTHELMATEFVARAHYRELLERLATGADTRPGTAAEVCCACSQASMTAPLTPTVSGLYLRMWAQAFPDRPVTDLGQHHEALDGTAIDVLETSSRRALTHKDRTLTTITCTGQHHGEPVHCTFSTQLSNEQPGQQPRGASREVPDGLAKPGRSRVQDLKGYSGPAL